MNIHLEEAIEKADEVVGNIDPIVFSGWTILGYWITTLFYFLVPLAFYFLLYKWNIAKIYPVIVGAITYFLSVKICDVSVMVIFFSAPFAIKQAAASELVGLFEESGRLVAMKYPVSGIKSVNDVICYAVGHAGLECWMRGVNTLKLLGYIEKIYFQGIENFTANANPEKAEEVISAAKVYAENNFFYSIMDQITVVIFFVFHIALSLLIYKKLIEDDLRKRWLLLAIGLHFALNELSGLASLTGNLFFKKFVAIVTAIGIIIFVSRIIDGKKIYKEIAGL